MRIIGGEARGRTIRGPRGAATRPTSDRVREAIFDILGPRTTGSRFLDVCAGCGAVGVEALSRGASRAVFLEQGRENLKVIASNLTVGAWEGMAEIVPGDALRGLHALGRRGESFDIAFLDPPYGSPATPPLVEAAGRLLATGAVLLLEHRSSEPVAIPGGLALRKVYRHGDTAITLFDAASRSDA